MSEFNELLIAEIKKRNVLWNTTNNDHKNKHITKKEWSQISKALGVTKEAAKMKWNILRNSFQQELFMKPKRSKNGSLKPYRSKWIHYDSMLFLKDFLTNDNESDKVNGNVTSSESNEEHENMMFHMNDELTAEQDPLADCNPLADVADYDIQSEPNDFDPPQEDDCSYETNQQRTKRKRKNINYNDELDEEMIATVTEKKCVKQKKAKTPKKKTVVENGFHSTQDGANSGNNEIDAAFHFAERLLELKEQSVTLETENSDPDLCFFRALLPFMKSFNMEQKLALRTDIQNAILTHFGSEDNKNSNPEAPS